MPITVDVPEVGEIEFPDGLAPEKIQDTIDAKFFPERFRERTASMQPAMAGEELAASKAVAALPTAGTPAEQKTLADANDYADLKKRLDAVPPGKRFELMLSEWRNRGIPEPQNKELDVFDSSHPEIFPRFGAQKGLLAQTGAEVANFAAGAADFMLSTDGLTMMATGYIPGAGGLALKNAAYAAFTGDLIKQSGQAAAQVGDALGRGDRQAVIGGVIAALAMPWAAKHTARAAAMVPDLKTQTLVGELNKAPLAVDEIKQGVVPQRVEVEAPATAAALRRTLENVPPPEEAKPPIEKPAEEPPPEPPAQPEPKPPIERTADASQKPSPESLPEHEVRPRVGETPPLRQQGETAAPQGGGTGGEEVAPEKSETKVSQEIEQFRDYASGMVQSAANYIRREIESGTPAKEAHLKWAREIGLGLQDTSDAIYNKERSGLYTSAYIKGILTSGPVELNAKEFFAAVDVGRQEGLKWKKVITKRQSLSAKPEPKPPAAETKPFALESPKSEPAPSPGPSEYPELQGKIDKAANDIETANTDLARLRMDEEAARLNDKWDEQKRLVGEIKDKETEIEKLKTAYRTAKVDLFLAKWEKEVAPFRGKPAQASEPKLTGKVLKAQKDNLLSQVGEAIKSAPETGTDKITFDVPGDGSFTIENNKAQLKKFRDHAAKKFPATVARSSEPTLASGKGKALPTVKEAKPDELGKLAGQFVSEDEYRLVLKNAYADGTQIVATDGRQLVRIVSDKAPGTPINPVRLNPDGTINKTAEGRYPNYNQVRPAKAELVYGGLNTETLWHIAQQAKVFRDASEADRTKRSGHSVSLYINPDRSIGAKMEVTGDKFEHNLQEGGIHLGDYNADYILDGMTLARKLGNETVDVYLDGDTGPIVFSGKNHEHILMPMRAKDFSTAHAEPSEFSRVAGKKEHGLLPEGLGPLENPEDYRSRIIEVEGSGKFAVNLEKGDLTIEKITYSKPMGYGGREEAHREKIGEIKLADLPSGEKTTSKVIAGILKDKTGTTSGKFVNEVAKAIKELAREREDILEEGRKRAASIGAGAQQAVSRAGQVGSILFWRKRGKPTAPGVLPPAGLQQPLPAPPNSGFGGSLPPTGGAPPQPPGVPPPPPRALTAQPIGARVAQSAVQAQRSWQKIVHTIDVVEKGFDQWFTRRTSAEYSDISQLLDAAHTVAHEIGRQTGNSIRARLPKLIDQEALTFAVQAGEDKLNLLQFERQINNAPADYDPALKKRALDAVNQAWRRWDDHDFYEAIFEYTHKNNLQRIQEHKANINTGYWDNYVPQKWDLDLMLGPNDPIVINSGGTGLGTGFTKGRTIANYATGIEAGYPFKTLNAADLLENRVRKGQELIQVGRWADRWRGVNDPFDHRPIITHYIPVTKLSGEIEMTVPAGYRGMHLIPGRILPVAVHKGYVALFKALTSESIVRNAEIPAAFLRLTAGLKHKLLLYDTFHGSRMMQAESSLTRSLPSYKRGLSLLEYSDNDLNRAVNANLITQDMADYARTNRADADLLVSNGLNVGRFADNMADMLRRDFFKTKFVNQWIFDKFNRGAMLESALIELRKARLAEPGANDMQLARKVSKNVNTMFGNLSRQGLFKSQSARDIANMIFLAPQWVEALGRRELKGSYQLGKAAVQAVSGTQRGTPFGGGMMIGKSHAFRPETVGKGVGTGLLAYFVANQVLNYATRGHPTWENPEEGQKLASWIPDVTGNSQGYFLNTLSVFGEITHDMLKYDEQKGSPMDAAWQIVKNKLGPMPRALYVLGEGEDVFEHKLRDAKDRVSQAAMTVLPLPIIASGWTSQKPGAVQKQLMASAGLKTDWAPTATQQIYDKARRFLEQSGKQKQGVTQTYSDAPYMKMQQALKTDDREGFKQEYQKLRDQKKTTAEIRDHFRKSSVSPFTGSLKDEVKFKRSLTPQEKELYERAKAEKKENYQKFLRFRP